MFRRNVKSNHWWNFSAGKDLNEDLLSHDRDYSKIQDLHFLYKSRRIGLKWGWDYWCSTWVHHLHRITRDCWPFLSVITNQRAVLPYGCFGFRKCTSFLCSQNIFWRCSWWLWLRKSGKICLLWWMMIAVSQWLREQCFP